MTVLDIPTPDPRTLDDVSREFAEAVASRYAIRKLIGRGGMGMVYLARDRRLDRLVAIKTLPPQVAEDESVRQRFLRETRMAGALSHPNIVPIHGADEVDGHAFFVMGLVDGDSLAARIRTEARLDATVTARILRDVAAALEHAHERGIIHRDVKAENILLDRATGRALVTDFGIARLAEAAPLTATGQVLGTVYYTSPEQVAGDRIDARSDLYSLGVVGFLALTGTFPFDGELASAVLIAHVNKRAPRVRSLRPDVPESLASIVDRCLAKSPAQRFGSARELCDALDAVLAEKPALVRADARMSDTQAQKVWQRAAELQAGEPLTSGVPVGHVRDAGREAGLATAFLDRALAERELAVEDSSKRSWWAGVPLEVELRAHVEREIEPRDFARVLGILRVASRDGGTTIASNREIAWRSAWHKYRLDASIVPADGRTEIVLSLSVRRMAAKVLAASVALGAWVGSVTTLVAYQMTRGTVHDWLRAIGHTLDVTRPMADAIAVLLGIAAGLAVLPLGRSLARRWYRDALARLGELRDALVSNMQTPDA